MERLEWAHAEFNFRTLAPYVRAGSRVLDVGAWQGYLGEFLQQRLGCQVLGLDVADASRTTVPFCVFDGRTFPLEPDSFDVVLLLYVLHHAADDERLLSEGWRVCAPGGIVLVAEDSVEGVWNRIITIGFHLGLTVVIRLGWDGQFRGVAEWQSRFRVAGFTIERTIPLGRHLGRRLWPANTLFVLRKRIAAAKGSHPPLP